MGCVSVADLDDVGPEPLINELQLESDLANRIVEAAGEEAIHQEEAKEAAVKAKREAEAAGLPLDEEQTEEAASSDETEETSLSDEVSESVSGFVAEPASEDAALTTVDTPEADEAPATAESEPVSASEGDVLPDTVVDDMATPDSDNVPKMDADPEATPEGAASSPKESPSQS